jgi:DNA-binding NtrC family response regulator
MKKPLILVVDDDKELLKNLGSKIKRWGFDCLTACDGIEALEVLKDNPVDLVLTDQQMPKMDGLTLLKEIKSKHGGVPFIMLTAFGTVDKAVLSIRHGADDYLQKPYDPDNLLATIKRSLSYYKLSKENKQLKSTVRDQYSFKNIVTKSEKMQKALELANKVAESPDTTVLIYGESGTGKEILSKAIHYASERVGSNFVAINCAGIPSNLLESELFGHVKGAFTGADKDRDGKFDLAQNGSILLDEIGDMPIDLQAKLLRTLQEKTYEKVGSNRSIKSNFRIIAATHRNLQEMVHKGTFREDLYHRINFFPISLPPLQERKEDIPLLANHFIGKFTAEFKKGPLEISKKAMDALINYSWPGNIRELNNCIGRAVILADGNLIQPHHLIITKSNHSTSANMVYFDILLPEEKVSMDNITDEVLNIVLKRFNNNRTKAAEYLKLNRKTLSRRIP